MQYAYTVVMCNALECHAAAAAGWQPTRITAQQPAKSKASDGSHADACTISDPTPPPTTNSSQLLQL
jgi:hypothetical protein